MGRYHHRFYHWHRSNVLHVIHPSKLTGIFYSFFQIDKGVLVTTSHFRRCSAASTMDKKKLDLLVARDEAERQALKDRPELTPPQIARYQYQLSKLLKVGETVADALRRTGAGSRGIRPRGKGKGGC